MSIFVYIGSGRERERERERPRGGDGAVGVGVGLHSTPDIAFPCQPFGCEGGLRKMSHRASHASCSDVGGRYMMGPWESTGLQHAPLHASRWDGGAGRVHRVCGIGPFGTPWSPTGPSLDRQGSRRTLERCSREPRGILAETSREPRGTPRGFFRPNSFQLFPARNFQTGFF
jgi:hypothetical protein